MKTASHFVVDQWNVVQMCLSYEQLRLWRGEKRQLVPLFDIRGLNEQLNLKVLIFCN